MRAGRAPPLSRAFAGTSIGFNCPARTRKLTKSLAAKHTKHNLAAGCGYMTFKMKLINLHSFQRLSSSLNFRLRHTQYLEFAPHREIVSDALDLNSFNELAERKKNIVANFIKLPVGRLSYAGSLRDLAHHSLKNDLISDMFNSFRWFLFGIFWNFQLQQIIFFFFSSYCRNAMAIDINGNRSQLTLFDSRRCWYTAEYELPDELVSIVRNTNKSTNGYQIHDFTFFVFILTIYLNLLTYAKNSQLIDIFFSSYSARAYSCIYIWL